METCPSKCSYVVKGSAEWCQYWKPPVLPSPSAPEYAGLINFIRNNRTLSSSFGIYNSACNRTIVEPDAEPTTTAAASSSLVAILVTVFIIIIVIALVFLYLWWRNKKRRRYDTDLMMVKNTTALPLEKYDNTTYLDNKARNNQCWKSSTEQMSDDKTSSTGDKRSSGQAVTENKYIKMLNSENGQSNHEYNNTNKQVEECLGESPRVVQTIGISTTHSSSSVPTQGYYNTNFVHESEGNAGHSPGVDSNTPLFDDVDGLLPNTPQINHQLQADKINTKQIGNVEDQTSNDPLHNGVSTASVPQGRLPPIVSPSNETGNNERKSSVTSKSPKKKSLSRLLNRKSTPVEGLDDIVKDNLAGNRKSV